jgi:hypothetical protein
VAIAAVLSPVEFTTKMAVRVRDSSRAASALCMHRLATEVTASVALPVVCAGTPFTIIGTAATVIKLVAVVDMPRMFGAGVAAHRVEVQVVYTRHAWTQIHPRRLCGVRGLTPPAMRMSCGKVIGRRLHQHANDNVAITTCGKVNKRSRSLLASIRK